MALLQAESPTVICLRALALAEHDGNFTSLEDETPIAREARLRYDIRRRTVLEALDWRFARRRVAGQGVNAAVSPVGHEAAWQRPTECIRIRGVWDATGCLIPHVVEEVIFTAEVGAVQIVYTGDVFDAARFPPVFTTALELLLASDFAMKYARSINRRDSFLQDFRRAMSEADSIEAAELSQTEAFAPGPWADAITSRSFGGY